MKYSVKIAGPQICYRTENLVNFIGCERLLSENQRIANKK